MWKYFSVRLDFSCPSVWSLSRDFRNGHITLTEILLSCSSLAIEDHPLSQNLSSFHHSFSSFTFSPSSSIPGFLSSSQSFLYLSLSGLSLNYPGTLHSLHLCPSLRQWHMDCVNSWAAGQPQIRYEHTAHEAQLFFEIFWDCHQLHTHLTQLVLNYQLIKPD